MYLVLMSYNNQIGNFSQSNFMKLEGEKKQMFWYLCDVFFILWNDFKIDPFF